MFLISKIFFFHRQQKSEELKEGNICEGKKIQRGHQLWLKTSIATVLSIQKPTETEGKKEET